MSKVGGAYAALMGKKKTGAQNNQTNTKPKAAKVISLSDTKDIPKKQKEQKVETKAPKAEKEPERELSRREQKDERSAGDRGAPRIGHAPAAGKKTDNVKDAVDAANEAPAADEYDLKKKEWEERDAEKKRLEAEEAKKISYSEYEKQQVERKAELGVKKLEARKVSALSNLKTFEKEEDNSALDFGSKKVQAEKKPEPKKGAKAAVAPEGKKKGKKFAKAEIQLGFTIQAQNTQNARPDRVPRPDRAPRPVRPTPAPAAAPATEAAAPAAAE